MMDSIRDRFPVAFSKSTEKEKEKEREKERSNSIPDGQKNPHNQQQSHSPPQSHHHAPNSPTLFTQSHSESNLRSPSKPVFVKSNSFQEEQSILSVSFASFSPPKANGNDSMRSSNGSLSNSSTSLPNSSSTTTTTNATPTTPSPNGTLRDSASHSQNNTNTNNNNSNNSNLNNSINNLNSSNNSNNSGGGSNNTNGAHTSKHVRAKSQSANEDIEDKFFGSKLDTFKTFVQTTLHSMKSRKTHTCKVTAITGNDKLELFVSDGTFGTEGLSFLRLSQSQENNNKAPLLDTTQITELLFEFDLPYDIMTAGPELLNQLVSLPSLSAFSLKTNYIQTIPSQLFLLNLKKLSLANNQLKTIPSEIGNLGNLTTLNFSHNQIQTIPKELGRLSNLSQLILSCNKITALPPSINQLISLKSLILDKNKIELVPDFEGLSQLQELNLRDNLLIYHDKPFSLEGSLINKVKTIAIGDSNTKSFRNLISLKILDLRGNKLAVIPDSVVELPSLEKLMLARNLLLSAEIPPTPSFTFLDLSQNKLTAWPTGSSSSLLHLNLSHNNLSSISTTAVSNVPSLKELALSNNTLSDLSFLKPLVNLQKLLIANNNLKNNLSVLSSLTSLTLLDLSGNSINSISLSWNSLTNLESLNLSRNDLQTLPSSLFKNLKNLKKFYCADNRLSGLPYSISCLNLLNDLRLHNNNIMVFPAELTSLSNLTELSVSNIHVSSSGELSVGYRKTIEEQHQQSLEQIRSHEVLSLCRSCPHPLLLYSVYLIVEEGSLQDNLVKQGLITDLLHWVSTLKGKAQLDCIKMLGMLSKKGEYAAIINDEDGMDMLVDLLSEKATNSETKFQIAEVIGNITLDENQAQTLCENKHVIEVLQTMMKTNEEIDESVRKLCRRTLAILGVLDFVPSTRGIRVLSLDGGGVKGVVTVEILKKIEQVTGKRIHELFDLIVGTSAGAMTMSCLAAKKWTLDRIQYLQDKMAQEIFAHGATPTEDSGILGSQLNKVLGRVDKYTNMLRFGSVHSSKDLENLIVGAFGDTAMMIDSVAETDVKLCAVTSWTSVFPPQIFLCRNYNYPPREKRSRHRGSFSVKFWEALRASSAAPGYFDEAIINNERYVDGGVICNNPSVVALAEAKCLWPHKKIDCIVSVGTGQKKIYENTNGYLERMIQNVVEAATSSDRSHETLDEFLPSNVYYRFQPVDERFMVKLDEHRVEKIEDLRQAARDYIEANEERFIEMAKILLSPTSHPNSIPSKLMQM